MGSRHLRRPRPLRKRCTSSSRWKSKNCIGGSPLQGCREMRRPFSSSIGSWFSYVTAVGHFTVFTVFTMRRRSHMDRLYPYDHSSASHNLYLTILQNQIAISFLSKNPLLAAFYGEIAGLQLQSWGLQLAPISLQSHQSPELSFSYQSQTPHKSYPVITALSHHFPITLLSDLVLQSHQSPEFFNPSQSKPGINHSL